MRPADFLSGAEIVFGTLRFAPVGGQSKERIYGAFDRFNQGLPKNAESILVNPDWGREITARMMRHGLHNERGRLLWFTIPLEGDYSVRYGKYRLRLGRS